MEELGLLIIIYLSLLKRRALRYQGTTLEHRTRLKYHYQGATLEHLTQVKVGSIPVFFTVKQNSCSACERGCAGSRQQPGCLECLDTHAQSHHWGAALQYARV